MTFEEVDPFSPLRPTPKDKKEETKAEKQEAKNLRKEVFKNQPIDDVYDKEVFLEGYQLSTFRDGNVIDYMSMMELEPTSYIQQLKTEIKDE